MKHLPLMTIFLLLFGCEEDSGYAKVDLRGVDLAPVGDTVIQGDIDEPDAPCADTTSTNVICDPFGDDDVIPESSNSGLHAKIYEGQAQWYQLDRYFTEGVERTEDIYFSNFNVPSRSFSQGFGTDGEYLKDRNGERLVEWFAIRARGFISLPASESDGSYHLVTISDDGIKVTVDGTVVISNPGAHAPTIDCGQTLTVLTKATKKTFELQYFQGPREHIALMTFIKKVDDASTFQRASYCSTTNGPSALLDDGYKVISPDYFTFR
ncbi:MAG TPA: hypothetical protein VNJ01_18195 [Bacteriovoracaceae bacterium]|nr:hypothetical protein [Bacteriovoracaceae bacterium]